jgi:hypothetical protein
VCNGRLKKKRGHVNRFEGSKSAELIKKVRRSISRSINRFEERNFCTRLTGVLDKEVGQPYSTSLFSPPVVFQFEKKKSTSDQLFHDGRLQSISKRLSGNSTSRSMAASSKG